MKPGLVPAATPRRHLSRKTALNLRLPGEETGDWHQETALFLPAGDPDRELPCAGEGAKVDTTPALGSKGVRDMSVVLGKPCGQDIREPVRVANHFRAIADIAWDDQARLARIADPKRPLTLRRTATSRAINSWLDTEAQVDRLVKECLRPLRRWLGGRSKALLDEWLPPVAWE